MYIRNAENSRETIGISIHRSRFFKLLPKKFSNSNEIILLPNLYIVFSTILSHPPKVRSFVNTQILFICRSYHKCLSYFLVVEIQSEKSELRRITFFG